MAKNTNNVTVEIPEVKTAEKKNIVEEKQPEIVVIEPAIKDKKVKIKVKYTFRQYIGSKWWEFKAGQEVLVPEYIKDMLQERGALEVI